MAEFYIRGIEDDKFNPTYGDIDWHSRLIAKLAIGNTERPNPIWFRTGDGLDQQCTQENTDIFLSQVSDMTDVVLVLDPRDNLRFSFYRDELGEKFNQVSQALQIAGAAAVHFTLYPTREIVETWENIRQGDLSKADYIPDEWENKQD